MVVDFDISHAGNDTRHIALSDYRLPQYSEAEKQLDQLLDGKSDILTFVDFNGSDKDADPNIVAYAYITNETNGWARLVRLHVLDYGSLQGSPPGDGESGGTRYVPMPIIVSRI